ncbi:hypothetical protein EXE46_12965 [Halorubrum sp. GN11_10-6_MGM]|uniref:hypothetical protein n=1 Tax=Halorubrum sp. GN11_10-6_MGM TaxID=2518112 RepID=UPI0010F7317C|nr:hypothetical protein [Halorubrum sp. GN11_10-6_MGM]TKX73701.1 hypothetical protein EXE46_12965 [Halorubrum sp. GN11_10-6_MGM]
MTRTGTWSFATTAGRVEVAPDEIRIRKQAARVAETSLRTLANGRVPPVGREVGWSAVASGIALFGALIEWTLGSGQGIGVAAFPLATALAGVAVTALQNARVDVPARDVRHVEFSDGDVVVVHEDDGEEAETALRPRSPAARNDAAFAFRLRGIEVRGADDAEGVSRTVVDAPEAELVA